MWDQRLLAPVPKLLQRGAAWSARDFIAIAHRQHRQRNVSLRRIDHFGNLGWNECADPAGRQSQFHNRQMRQGGGDAGVLQRPMLFEDRTGSARRGYTSPGPSAPAQSSQPTPAQGQHPCFPADHVNLIGLKVSRCPGAVCTASRIFVTNASATGSGRYCSTECRARTSSKNCMPISPI